MLDCDDFFITKHILSGGCQTYLKIKTLKNKDMAKKTNLQRMQKVFKDIAPALCKCKDYVHVSLHFDYIDNEFIVIDIGHSDLNNHKDFWFYSSNDDKTLKEKVNALKEYVESNY